MAEYIDREKIPWARVDHPKGDFWDRIVFERSINSMTSADVIEREKAKSLIEAAIEDSWDLDYALERLKEI